MKRTALLKWSGFGIAALLALAACRGPAPKQSTYSAEIRRTSFGIPHVVAKDEAGIGYGIGYAYAQDNICQFTDVIATVNSQRSRFFGPDVVGGPDFESNGGDVTNLQWDFFFQLVNAPEHVKKAWDDQDAESQALIRGYVAGFNRYLAETPADKLPAACRNAPWVRKLDELDIIRFMRRLAVEASSAQFAQAILAAKPPGSAVPASAANLPDITAWRKMREEFGSNAAAFGKEATENGRGLLLGNPHYPWYGSLRFYQLHITIPGKVDAMGATIGGFPVVSIGFNKDLAWSHTVNTSMHFVLYSLELDAGDATKYLVDGESRALTRKTVTVDVKEPDGSIKPRSHDFWLSEYGPVLVPSKELSWSTKRAYALHDANFDNNRMIATWYAMDRAKSLDDLEDAIKSHLGIPWVNTIAADSAGGTLYTDITVVPRLTKAKQDACIAEPYRKLTQHGLFVLTASAACGLESSPDAPQPGVFAGNELPVLRRADFIQNSNDSAWLTNPAAALTGFPDIVSTQDSTQDNRTRLGISQAQARLAGTDGLRGNRINAEKLKAIAFSNRSYLGTLLRSDLLAVCDGARTATFEGKTVDLTAACATFKAWDGHANLDSVGYPLAEAWIINIEDDGTFWQVPFSKEDPVNTPRGIRRSDARVVKGVRTALASAVVKLQKEGIDPGKPWGEIQGIELNGRRIPISGGQGTGFYNLIWREVANGLMKVRGGSSYVQVVGFDEQGPHAEGFLTYSQSTNPASPHFADQTLRFSALEWIPQPFSEEQIRKDVAYKTTAISE